MGMIGVAIDHYIMKVLLLTGRFEVNIGLAVLYSGFQSSKSPSWKIM